jgi:hypothetical protein
MKNKKYRVDVRPAVRYFEVEARDEQEAIEKAFDEYDGFCTQQDFLEFIPKVVKKFNTIDEKFQ